MYNLLPLSSKVCVLSESQRVRFGGFLHKITSALEIGYSAAVVKEAFHGQVLQFPESFSKVKV